MKLSDICVINMGQSPDSSTYNESGKGLPFFQGNADFGKIHPTVRVWCSEPKKIAEPNDILISVRAPIGALNIADIKCCIGRGLASLTVDNAKGDNNYIWYALESKVDYLVSMGTGSTFKAISKNILFDLDIPLSPLSTQKHIAANLDKATQTIDLCNEILEKLDLLVKARFVEMFGDVKLNSKALDTIQLEKIADVGSSKRVFVEELQESGIPFYRGTEVGALAEGKDIVPELFITEEHYNTLKEATGIPVIGDLLMPSICSDGRIWLVNSEDKFYFKDGRVLWIHPVSQEINSVYLLYYLKQKIAVDYSSIASGTTFAELKIFALKSLRILNPPLELQNQFAAFVEKTDRTKAAVKQVLAKAETLKKALMQEYFG